MKKFGNKFPFDYQHACLKKGLSMLTITLLIILTSTLNLFASGNSSPEPKMSLNADQPSAGFEMQQEKKITGTVTDAKGQPLTGVTVTAKGTTSGTLTDLKGKYELNVPGRAETLVFSFVGMKSQEAGIGNRNVVDVALQEELIQIDEVDSYTYTNPTTGAVTKIQPNAKAGDLKFIDQDGNGSIGDGDRVFMGSAFPKMTYGFSGNLGWKNWEFNVFFQGVGGVKLFNAFKEATLNAAEQGYNRWNKILDAWSPTNTGSNIPIIKSTDPNKNFGTCSDWYLENGNYMRLKNLLIGYTFKDLPWDIKLRIYFSGENLLTFTKYSGFDPEVGGYTFKN